MPKELRNNLPETVFVFANPIAGRGKGKMLAKQIELGLSDAGFGVRTFFQRPAEGSVDASPERPDAVICIGGDGTLRSVVNYFFQQSRTGPPGASAASLPPVLPVPMGTANLMARHLGIQWSGREWSARQIVLAVVKTIERRNVVRLDAAVGNGQLFLLMAGVGIDAQIVYLLDQMRRGPIDFTSYILPAAITFASYSFPSITVSVDSRSLIKNQPAIAMISNIKEYGIGFPILPDARPDDGLLDICVMPCQDRRQLIEILVHIVAGEHSTRDDVINVQGKEISLRSAEPVPVQLDGDSAGFTPMDVQIVAARVPFLLPV